MALDWRNVVHNIRLFRTEGSFTIEVCRERLIDCWFFTHRLLSLIVTNKDWAHSNSGPRYSILCLIKWTARLLAYQSHFRVVSRTRWSGHLDSLRISWAHIKRYLNDILIVIMNVNRGHFLPLHLLLLLLLMLDISILDIYIITATPQIIWGHVKDLGLLVLPTESRSYTILV